VKAAPLPTPVPLPANVASLGALSGAADKGGIFHGINVDGDGDLLQHLPDACGMLEPKRGDRGIGDFDRRSFVSTIRGNQPGRLTLARRRLSMGAEISEDSIFISMVSRWVTMPVLLMRSMEIFIVQPSRLRPI